MKGGATVQYSKILPNEEKFLHVQKVSGRKLDKLNCVYCYNQVLEKFHCTISVQSNCVQAHLRDIQFKVRLTDKVAI